MEDKSILPWGVSGIQPGSLKTITTDKLATFAIGANKKSRFQKAKEEKEAKAKAEAEEAANVYNSFVASFEGDDDDDNNDSKQMPMKTFIKEGNKTKNMESLLIEMKQKEKNGNKRFSSVNQPSHYTNNNNYNTNNSSTNNSNNKHNTNTHPKERVKEMDLFLEELKNKNPSDSQRDNYLPPSNEELTTNLYIGNISPTVTEERLYELFRRYGEINSIKIMWPRTEEERVRRRNCGFISFMKRKDAEDAKNELNDFNFEDYKMSLQWSKSVKINATPYILSTTNTNHDINTVRAVEETKVMMQEGRSFIDIYQARLATFQSDAITSAAPSTTNRKWDEVPSINEPEMVEGDSCINIKIPTDKRTQALIDLTAKFVAADGDNFEKVIKQREKNNHLFSFLFQPESSEGQYYRWRTYANIVGDIGKRYRTKPFKLIVDGPFIIPPKRDRKRSRLDQDDNDRSKTRRRSRSNSTASSSSGSSSSSNDIGDSRYHGMTGAQIERAKANERAKAKSKQRQLSQRSYNQFKDILLNLTISNSQIKFAMGFVYDHVESADEIINILKNSLLDNEIMIPNSENNNDDCTPMPIPASAKIARLYLLSDILHNSGAPIKNASIYRNVLQPLLPEIFEHLGTVLRSKYKIGRMSGKQIEEKVASILSAWMEWSILPQPFMLGLESAFYQTEADVENIRCAAEKDKLDSNFLDLFPDKEILLRQAKNNGIYYNASSTPSEVKLKLEISERYAHKRGFKQNMSIDGLPVDDIGKKINDIDGVPIDDEIDGVPIDYDVDGVPIDDDIDGVPIEDDIDGVPIN